MKKVLLYLILIMAVGMAGTVAFISVTGLLKVFAGAGTSGLVFFITLEIAKIIATSAIHTYGKIIGWGYNIILSLFILITMAITSLGVYGFLSSTYKESFSKMENMGSQIELLENRRDSYQKQLTSVDTEKESVTQTITELSKGLSNNVIQYKDPETGEIITTTSSSTRKALEKQLDRATDRQTVLNVKSDELSDKVFEIEGEITDVKLSDGTSTELGPLKYLADVTGLTMDEVMKWFILLLIVVGDPMAVIMVIIFNKVINYGKKDDGPTDDGHTPKGDDKGDDAGNNTPNESSWDKLKALEEQVDNMYEIKELKVEDFRPVDNQQPKMEVVHKGEDDSDYHSEIEEEAQQVFVVPVEEPKVKALPELKPRAEEPIFKVPEEVEVKEVKNGKIVREDIKEVKELERNFSVTIPTRKKNANTVDRIGTNKEVRDGNNDVVHFKRR